MLFPAMTKIDTHTSSGTEIHNPNGGSTGNNSGSKSCNSNVNKKFIPPHKRKLADQFQPPKSMGEVFQRMGRPVLIRSAGGCVAFFVAGALQTYMQLQ